MNRDDRPLDDAPAEYDRPHLRWTCGLESAGCPCATGPSASGHCPGAAECLPIRDGDRWICNRSDGRGGPCEEGPSPAGECCLARQCRPRRTLRVHRGRWMTAAAALTVGLLLMAFGSSQRNELIAPGPLSSHHAQVITREDWNGRCASCHPNGAQGAARIVAAGFLGATVGASPHGATQSSLCLDCHKSLAEVGLEPMLAHGLPAKALHGGPGANDSGSQLACAVCHQEHHGADHDLTRISDRRCQSCHTSQYDGFAADHPDFGAWPYERRTRIAFNHASHAGPHFEKAGKAFDCRTCHLADATGDLTARPDYAAACAGCHEADLVASTASGVPLVALPMLDDAALDEAGRPLREWPAVARGDFDGELPPLTKLLLAADPQANRAIRHLGEDFSFFDVSADVADDVAAAADVVESLRALLDELQEEGHGNLDYRLRTLLGSETVPLADLVSRLPVELVDQLQAAWFASGEAVLPAFDAIEDRRTGGGWRLDERTLSLRYRPTGHDDPFLRAWIDTIVALPDEHAELREACLAEFTGPAAPGACLTCHSVDRDPADRPVVHWRGRDRLAEPRSFTFFSHRPHLTQPELADCTRCHQIDPTGASQPEYAGGDPRSFRSEFVALSKASCVECHQPHAAGSRCTQCHNYHVEASAPSR